MAGFHPQTSSPLFRLPTEIRERIQRFALTDNDLLAATRPAAFPEAIFRTYGDALPGIMCTCKRMYLEMRPFAFTEVVVHHTPSDSSGRPRLGIKSHGNLRFERVRRMSLVVDQTSPDFTRPLWHRFLLGLLAHCPEIDRLDIEFGENGFREEVEARLSAAEHRRQTGASEPEDDDALASISMPPWLEDVARQPSLRRLCFEGNVPPVWLSKVRQRSEGRIQVMSDGMRFRERQTPVETVAEMEDPSTRVTKGDGVRDPQIQFVYEAASRFDKN